MLVFMVKKDSQSPSQVFQYLNRQTIVFFFKMLIVYSTVVFALEISQGLHFTQFLSYCHVINTDVNKNR